jgi:hypothetical protein
MKERVEHILGNNEARNLYIGTFHSVFARILRVDAPKMGYPSNFTIYDTDDAKSVVKTVINELNLDDKHYKPNTVYNRISSAKKRSVNADEYANDYGLQQEDMRSNRPAIAQIYKAYVNRCFKNGAMDFDDLLLKFYELLKNFPKHCTNTSTNSSISSSTSTRIPTLRSTRSLNFLEPLMKMFAWWAMMHNLSIRSAVPPFKISCNFKRITTV